MNFYALTGAVLLSICALKFVIFWLRIIYLYVIPRDQRQRLRAYGEWAIVTGCTDGIGREYALQLAEKGMNIVLISRSADKLNSIADVISNKFSVKTKTIVADFTRLDIYESIQKGIADLDIGVLVNNVGIGDFEYENPKVGDKPRSALTDTVICNCVSQSAMCNIVLPKMAANRRGLVVNLSSGSAVSPVPYLAVYGATKRYNLYLGEATRIEYAEFGVEVQNVLPMYIATNLSNIRRSNFFVKTPQAFVRSHMNTWGVTSYCHGCIAHEMQAAIISISSKLPSCLSNFLMLRRMKSTARLSIAAKKRRAEASGKKQN